MFRISWNGISVIGKLKFKSAGEKNGEALAWGRGGDFAAGAGGGAGAIWRANGDSFGGGNERHADGGLEGSGGGGPCAEEPGAASLPPAANSSPADHAR
jgi:hypothetical protein